MKKHFLLLIALLFCTGIYSQRSVKVCGEIDYVVPETQTQAEAKKTAITQAQLKAIADQFGTVVSQTNLSEI